MMTNYPKIGIRPTIDGRRQGVRESLEQQTYQMAQSVSKLISQHLKYLDGTPVQCVISPSTIGRVTEAAASQQLFSQENVCATLTVTPCWCYGSETMDITHDMPHAIWGFNGTERPGAVYLAAVLAAHAQKGIPAFGIYGKDVQDADETDIPQDVQDKILQYARAAIAVGQMRHQSYLSIGNVSMGIAGSIVNDQLFQDYLGMRTEYVDMTELIRRIEGEIYDKDEYDKAIEWVRYHIQEGDDLNRPDLVLSREEKDRQWAYVTKMYLVTRDLMIGNPRLAELGFEEEALGHHAICGGFQGQRQWTDFLPNGDFMETMLNTQFDWNGIRRPYIFATENDALNGISMLFNYLLTNTPQIFADVRTYWSPEAVKRVTGHQLTDKAQHGFLHLINSGSCTLDGTGQAQHHGQPVMKPFWELTKEETDNMLKHTKFPVANREYFRGGGFSTQFLTRGDMPVTMVRLNMLKGVGPVLQIAEGYTLTLPEDVHQTLDQRTDPGWPTTWFAPRLTGKGAFKTVYDVMDNWGANHGAISYGHIGKDLITLAAMLRIPVNMHNVEEQDIFRPKAWGLFGTADLESADYRACQTFGPLYE